MAAVGQTMASVAPHERQHVAAVPIQLFEGASELPGRDGSCPIPYRTDEWRKFGCASPFQDPEHRGAAIAIADSPVQFRNGGSAVQGHLPRRAPRCPRRRSRLQASRLSSPAPAPRTPERWCRTRLSDRRGRTSAGSPSGMGTIVGSSQSGPEMIGRISVRSSTYRAMGPFCV